jgi:hypothetical protein
VQNRWIAAAVIAASLLALGLQTRIVARTGFLMGDFRAFYCAARVASHGADPYRTEPLRSCELAVASTRFFQTNRGVTIPAPLPGYALAVLAPLSLLPFAVAASLWAAILMLAWIACVLTLARFADVSWDVALAAFALSMGALSLPFGEVVPVAVAWICISAYFAWRGRWLAAAFSAAGAMIEPHLGLSVCIALAIWAPRTRLALALSACVLGVISLAFLGRATNLEYFTSVLPAHALSEIARDTQYSLTAILYSLGAAPGVALRAGALWYLAMLALGALLGGLLARKTKNNAFLVCVPPAFAAFGGTFIHVTQIAAALPAALSLAASTRNEYRAVALAALLALAVPWSWILSPALLVAPLFPIAYLAWRYWGDNLRAILTAGFSAAALSALLIALPRPAPHVATQRAMPAVDARLAESSWSAFTQISSTNGIAAWAVRIPTWAGLLLLLLLVTREAMAVPVSAGGAMRYTPREAP